MIANDNNQSEVAYIIRHIQMQCEAIERVMHDPGYSATHETIRRRYHILGMRTEQLATHIGDENARTLMCDVYNATVK